MSTLERLGALVPHQLRQASQPTGTELVVYCSGGVAKSTDIDQKLCWSESEKAALQVGADPVVVSFLDPGDPLPELSDSTALFGRDMLQIEIADAVVVDARQRRGIGIGIEMLAARLFGTNLVAVVPPDSHYRREDLHFRGGTVAEYLHPHLAALSNAIVDDFEAAGCWLRSNGSKRPTPAAEETIENAIRAYRDRLLPTDPSMKDRPRRGGSRGKARLAGLWFGAH